jgi:hypothetical protein
MATVRELVTKWAFDADTHKVEQFNKGLKNASKRMQDVGGKIQKFSRNATIGVSLPLLFLGKRMVGIASEAQETQSKFNDVFMEISDEAQVMADNLSKNFGMARDEAQELLANTADLLIGFGFTRKEALKLSNAVQELSVDLVSFTNFSGGVTGASRALTKALLGETEQIKSLNKVVRQEDIMNQVRINAAKGLIFETKNQAKAQATLNIIQEQSRAAIGNYARTQEDFANVLRKTESEMRDLSATLGGDFIPQLSKLLTRINGVLDRFSQLDAGIKKIILAIGGLGIVLPPIILIFGTLIKSVGVIVGAFSTLGPIFMSLGIALRFMLGPLGIAVAGFMVIKDILAYIDGRKSVLGNIINQVKGIKTPEQGKQFFMSPIPAPSFFGNPAQNNNNNQSIHLNAPINVNVPPSTDQASIGPAITDGIRTAMNDTFRQAVNYSSPVFTV